MAKYAQVAAGQQKQLAGVKARAEAIMKTMKAIQTSFIQVNDGYGVETPKFLIEDIGEMQYTKNNEFEEWSILRKIQYNGTPTATGISYVKVFINPKELYEYLKYDEFPSSCTPEYIGCTDNLKLCQDKARDASANPNRVAEREFNVYWRKKITTPKSIEKKALSFTVDGKNIVLKSGESYKITVTNLRFAGKTDDVVASIEAEKAEIMYAAAALYYNPTATLEIQGSVFITENEGWDNFVKYSNVNDYTWGTLADRRAAKVKSLVIKLYNGYPKNIANYRPIENRIIISRANINELRKNPNISQQSAILIIKN